jgi:hypothetical protein
MDVETFVPVIVEATKFVFGEVSKWLDQVRKRSKDPSSKSIGTVLDGGSSVLTQQEFARLEANPTDLISVINVQIAKTNAYEIDSFVQQIQIHRRNLVDFESAEAEFGALTPQHIKRGIERESSEIVEKSLRLRDLLEQVYGRKIEAT